MRNVSLGALVFLLLASSIATAADNGETIWIPMSQDTFFGTKDIRLEATLYKPDGPGPFPVVVFSHGSTGPGVIPRDQTERPWGFGEYLNGKGIALLAPMRRGRGQSEGDYKERYKCSAKAVRAGIDYAAQSLDATFAYLRTQTWADTTRIVLAGHSRGGILSVIYASRHPELSSGAINFSGGWVGDGCKEAAGMDLNLELFREAGQGSKVPSLFLYGSNDNYYSDASIEGFFEFFGEGGADAEFELLTVSYGANGHALFYDFWNIWIPYTDSFLKRLGLPAE